MRFAAKIAGIIIGAALAGGCVKVNGKTYGLGGDDKAKNGASSSSGQAGQSAPTNRDESQLPPRRSFAPEPLPTAPADPWAAVTGDQPLRLTEEQAGDWRVDGKAAACTGAIDHCFSRHVWMVEQDGSRDTERPTYQRKGVAFGFGADGGTISPSGAHGGWGPSTVAYTAYRTVPATKKNLVPGATIFVLGFPDKHPASAFAIYENSWVTGQVEKIDWDMGFVYLKGHPDNQLWISGTRVAVLQWRPGAKVTIMGGGTRDSIKVAASDVILP